MVSGGSPKAHITTPKPVTPHLRQEVDETGQHI